MYYVFSYTYIAMLEVQHMIDTTWIMSPRPVVPWGLRKALNWVRLEDWFLCRSIVSVLQRL